MIGNGAWCNWRQLARGLRGILAFDSRERDALGFFDAIVRKNADLLAAP